jgi:uncharacterized lipoprotein YddW (UPF0748 family)/N-acetylmuramoyl-L-alanine amidase
MKNKAIISIIFCIALALFSNELILSYAAPLSDARKAEINEDFKGLWVATVLNLDYPLKATTDSETLKNEALRIIEEADAMGLNAIVLQVRPSADALYKSSIYPWSKYLTGKQGLAPNDSFDPLAFWIEEAHKRDIAIHAWINPYRITKKTANEPALDYASLSTTHPAKLHPEWVVEHSDGNLYFNPGLPEVRKHIEDSIGEIIDNYDVDGIHFDDYFYPGTIFNDAQTFTNYGGSFASISDWRRNNVDQLIDGVYKLIKSKNPSIQFGVSPFGIWANSKNISTGSPTNGFESYFSQYADTKKWVQNNMIDYIAPQLYWNIGYSVADYSKLVSWWSDVAKNSTVNLYIGHAAYRVGNQDSSSPWYGVNEIYKQLKLNQNYANIDGSIFFRYGFFKNNNDLKSLVTNFYNGSNVPPVQTTIQDKLVIGRPAKDTQTTSAFYFIGGASDPRYPVTLNGSEIKIKTAQGYYGVYVPLVKGTNTFVIQQNGKSVKRLITRYSPAQAQPMAKVEIIESSVWPQNTRMIKNDEEISFYCKAPIGATVTATLYGTTYTLVPAVKSTTSTKPYATTYTFKTKVPTQTGKPRIVDLGKPVYRMTYKGGIYSATAKASVKVAIDGAPYIATISKDFVDSYQTASTSNGAHFILHRGMRDFVTGEYGDFVRLSSGLWVKKDNATVEGGSIKGNVLSKVSYIRSIKSDEIHFYMNEKVITTVSFNGSKLTVTLGQTSSGLPIVLPSEHLLQSATHKTIGNTTTYEFVLKDASGLSGYYLEDIKGGIKLVMKKKFIAYSESSNPQEPLKGAVIMLDPGHGGTDSGAIGLLGSIKPEKTIALEYTMRIKSKLEALGAKVVLTRSEDIYVSLNDRLAQSRKTLPDLFIAIHADSLDDASDLSKVNGFSVFYKDLLAKSFAEKVRGSVVQNLGRKDRGAKVMNFYIVRGTWTPSILLETGFMPNPGEFEWLSDPNEQERFADTLTNAILEYFTQN